MAESPWSYATHRDGPRRSQPPRPLLAAEPGRCPHCGGAQLYDDPWDGLACLCGWRAWDRVEARPPKLPPNPDYNLRQSAEASEVER